MNWRQAAAATAALAALAGCSATTTSPAKNGADPATAAGGAVSAATLSHLRSVISQAEAAPAWSAPGPPVSAAALRGKTIFAMPVNSEIDACNTQAADFRQLGQQLGASVQEDQTNGDPTQWSGDLQHALSGHISAIVMFCGIIPAEVSAELAQASKDGIPVVDGNYNEVTSPAAYAGLDGETAVNTAQGVTDDVDAAVVHLNGAPLHALIVTSSSIIQGPAATAAAQNAVQAACRACTYQTLDVKIQDWATQTQGEVQGALRANPDINAVIVVFDGMVQFAYNPVLKSGHPDIGIWTWGASRSVEQQMQERGSLIAADPGPDQQWDAWEAMDQVIRLLNAEPAAAVTQEVAPDRFWTPQNVNEFFGPDSTYGNEGYGGNAFINGFRHLWGLPQS